MGEWLNKYVHGQIKTLSCFKTFSQYNYVYIYIQLALKSSWLNQNEHNLLSFIFSFALAVLVVVVAAATTAVVFYHTKNVDNIQNLFENRFSSSKWICENSIYEHRIFDVLGPSAYLELSSNPSFIHITRRVLLFVCCCCCCWVGFVFCFVLFFSFLFICFLFLFFVSSIFMFSYDFSVHSSHNQFISTQLLSVSKKLGLSVGCWVIIAVWIVMNKKKKKERKKLFWRCEHKKKKKEKKSIWNCLSIIHSYFNVFDSWRHCYYWKGILSLHTSQCSFIRMREYFTLGERNLTGGM